MPPDEGGGIPLGGGEISDLQPLMTRVATAVKIRGLIQTRTDVSVWLCFIILSSWYEVWRHEWNRCNYWV